MHASQPPQEKLGPGASSLLRRMHGALLCFPRAVTAVVRCVSLRRVWRSADDPQLAEFLRLMQPRRAGNIWSNEDSELAKQSSQAAAKPRAASKLQAGGLLAAGSEAAPQPTEPGVSARRRRAAAVPPYHEDAAEGEQGFQACMEPCLMYSIWQAHSTTT